MQWIGLNGQIVPAASAVVSVMDHGFLYGMGLFETFRTYAGKPFLLDRHLLRISEACGILGIPVGPELSEGYISEWISQLMKANELQEAYVRLTISAGEDILGLPAAAYTKPSQVLMVKPLLPVAEHIYAHGKPLQRLMTKRNTPEGPLRLKSLHYMNNIMAKRELSTYPAAIRSQAEGLMMSHEGYVAEGIVSNIFFVKNGCLFTPHIDTGILPGITRALVLELATEQGISCKEGFYDIATLLEADEIFLTSSIQELIPVTSFLDTEDLSHMISDSIGPVTLKLLQSYRQQTQK
ncbi:aminotransferase class IV [Paenibacillus pini]|uniref:Aminodeoxychorismate lyase n=1 Tax=Paenibacillus pini JCM 16418 TaxID=1236976 RepID=W7Z864_9BACL|nr:aminotransferase class IV [Paenibacillus pini]GAF10589.1 aminodeoxychorismate lyase [Paenibacillus pini JCM 16418]